MEEVEFFGTIEQARNAALEWLEQRGGAWGGARIVTQGKFGALAERENGIATTDGTQRRLRVDFDLVKGAHFNAEAGKGGSREKKAFCFHGGEFLIDRLANARNPRG